MVGTPGNDDPWARGLDDKLGVGDEAKAFARFVAAAGFTPPIAIGIFGEWGSGKSFFMRLMYEHIERLRAGKPSKEAPEAGDDAFLREIVQIRFNAWHYAETNLWASLVDHIFAELDRWLREANQPEQSDALLENLSTARELTLEAAEQLAHRRHEQRDAATRLEKAEQALRDARVAAGASKAVFWSALGSALKANDGKELAATKDSFVTAAERLGIRDVQNSAQDFQKAVSVLGNEVERARLFKQQVSERLSRGWVVVLIAFSCVAVPVALVLLRNALGALPQLVEFKQIHASLLAVSGWLGSGAVLLATVTGKVKGALDLLEDSKRRLDGAVEREVQAQAKEVVEEQQKVVKLTAETEEARALLTTTSDRLAQATRQYASGTGRGRLMSFIRARATGGDYARHLGLVATIRKDFEELAANVKGATQPLKEDLEKARQAFAERVKKLVDASKDFLTAEELAKLEQAATAGTAQEMQPSFERIVLYIDDLDRCPSDKVAAVLQAVHLLLTFPLFVVVVAVDVRWVGRALKQHYPDLLAEEAGSAATAHDYLEKIFQLPYWVRPMQAKASRDFLADRAKLQLKAASRAPAPPPIATPDPPRTGAHRQPGGSPPLPSPRRSTAAPAAAVIEEPARGAGTAPPSVAVTANRSTAFPESVAAPSLDARTLTLADDELGYIDALAPHVASSPRRALRFLNVYRVIKASLKPSDLDALTNGGYRALMTQLAVATGAPNLLDDWLAHLQRKPAHPNLEALTTAVSSEPWFSKTAECARLTGALGAYGAALTSNAHVEEPIGAIANYGDITRRYSFTGWTRVVAAPRSVSNVHADNDPGAIDPTPPAE